MKLLAENSDLIIALSGENSLIDSKIIKYEIIDDEFLRIALTFKMRVGSSFRKIKVKFEDISEFHIYYDNSYIFGNVEDFKLINIDNQKFFFCFDPSDRDESISDNDQDYIICKSIFGYILD